MTKVALRKTGSPRTQKQQPIASPAPADTPSPNTAPVREPALYSAHAEAYGHDSEIAIEHPVNGDAKVQPPPVADRKRINDNRRANLNMLTTERGSKHRLAQLAGTSGSRISLMSSARKPVSDPFAFAIEDGLGLPRGWLDQPRAIASVPASVWQRLHTETAALAPLRTGREGAAMLPATGYKAEEAPSVDAVTTPAVTRGPRPGTVKAAASATGLFDKPAGQCGPIAEALAKTILNLSASDRLSEARAFQLLGALIAETEPEG